MKTTVIFDLDGTLLYTLQDLTDSVNFALSKYDFPECSVKQIRSFVGNGIKILMQRAVPDGETNLHFEECFNLFKSHYKENMYNKTAPYDGVCEMLEKLRNNGLKIAVVSNKFDTAVKELCKNYFDGKIDVALGESQTVKKKPAPDGVLAVISELNEDLKNCVYVGDSEVDIATAKNAGIDCISVDWGYKDKDFLVENGASVIVSDCNALYEQILKY